jgi:hypothetical protein
MAALNEREATDPNRYAPTAQGLANLSSDIAEELAKTAQAARQRQAGATARKSVPKPDAAPGANPRGVPDLKTMTQEQISKLSPEQTAEAVAALR